MNRALLRRGVERALGRSYLVSRVGRCRGQRLPGSPDRCARGAEDRTVPGSPFERLAPLLKCRFDIGQLASSSKLFRHTAVMVAARKNRAQWSQPPRNGEGAWTAKRLPEFSVRPACPTSRTNATSVPPAPIRSPAAFT